MSSTTHPERVRLLDSRLEMCRELTGPERTEVGETSLPVATITPGETDLARLLARHDAFGAAVLDGIVMSAQRIADHAGIQLLGPGDVLVQRGAMWPGWLSDVEIRAHSPVRLAMLGNDFLSATYRWPRIVTGLYGCMGDQLQRLQSQLVICQLPRVDERVFAMMWLLAESWGQMTSGGVRLPLLLTHETLGALVGARRPTVTLALRKLSRQGSILHQDNGWLLLEGAPEPDGEGTKILPPERLGPSISRWATPAVASDPSAAYAELRDTVRRLREQHAYDREQSREQLTRIRSARVRMNAARERISLDAVRRRVPPSS